MNKMLCTRYTEYKRIYKLHGYINNSDCDVTVVKKINPKTNSIDEKMHYVKFSTNAEEKSSTYSKREIKFKIYLNLKITLLQ